MPWKELDTLPGVYTRRLFAHKDARGSLTELMRVDDMPENWPVPKHGIIAPPPAMAYLSWSEVNQVRGPHEHREQFDYFIFAGPGAFELYLWDNRKPPDADGLYASSYLTVGEEYRTGVRTTAVVVPPGVVHGYKCIMGDPGWGGLVINLPTHLYQGWDKREEVDEIRHENDPDSPFKIPGPTIEVLDEQKLQEFIDNPPPGKPEPE